MARGVRTPTKKAAPAVKKPAAAKPEVKVAEVVDTKTTQPVTAAPTVVVKQNDNIDVQELVTADIGVATVQHTGDGVETTLDQIGFEEHTNMSNFDDKAAALAFYEEKLDIQIMESTDKNAEKFVFLSVNGEGAGPNGEPWLPRGVPVTVKRKHVEKLLRSRPSRYESQQYVDTDGERKVRYPETAALQYPFITIRDPNPKGPDWMKRILSERA